MSASVVVVIMVLLLLAAGMAGFALRRQPPVAPPPVVEPDDMELDALRTRQRILDARGSELLERRAELDARRGTLGGDTAVAEAFEELERRLNCDEISEEQFEVEKIRILGGWSGIDTWS